jgi:hypothetical protein
VATAPVGQATARLASDAGIATILSCQPGQFSHEALALGQGLFTTALLEGLRGGHYRTLVEVHRWLRDRLPELAEHHLRPTQRPFTICPPQKIHQVILALAPTEMAVSMETASQTVDVLLVDPDGPGPLAEAAWVLDPDGWRSGQAVAQHWVLHPLAADGLAWDTGSSDETLWQSSRRQALHTKLAHVFQQITGQDMYIQGLNLNDNLHLVHSDGNGQEDSNGNYHKRKFANNFDNLSGNGYLNQFARECDSRSGRQAGSEFSGEQGNFSSLVEPADHGIDGMQFDGDFWRRVWRWGSVAFAVVMAGLLLRTCVQGVVPSTPEANAQTGETRHQRDTAKDIARDTAKDTGKDTAKSSGKDTAKSVAEKTDTERTRTEKISTEKASTEKAGAADKIGIAKPVIEKATVAKPVGEKTSAEDLDTQSHASHPPVAGASRLAQAETQIWVKSPQASPYAAAIREASKIPQGHPEHGQAQRAIATWSQDIYTIAQRRAQRSQFDGAILAAALIQPGQAVYGDARGAIATWCPRVNPAHPEKSGPTRLKAIQLCQQRS